MSFLDDVIYVKSGDIQLGMWGIAEDIIMSQGDNVIMLVDLAGCSVVTSQHETYQTGTGRLAGGILGAALLGPIGAAAGLLAGGKTRVDETIVYCSLFDGRSFSGEVSQLTCAKLQHIASRNTRNQQASIQPLLSNRSDPVLNVGDSIECPMCAEVIKKRAKVCRFCGYNVAEAESEKILSAQADPKVESIIQLNECISAFRNAVDYEREISDEHIINILKSFSRLIKENPEIKYRQLSDLVKADLNIELKFIINDIVREGFKFIRECPCFDIADNLIIIKKKKA